MPEDRGISVATNTRQTRVLRDIVCFSPCFRYDLPTFLGEDVKREDVAISKGGCRSYFVGRESSNIRFPILDKGIVKVS
jgi:hypothetical protein